MVIFVRFIQQSNLFKVLCQGLDMVVTFDIYTVSYLMINLTEFKIK